MKTPLVVLIALCAFPSQYMPVDADPQQKQAVPLLRTLVDRDAQRSIEVVTDRRESLAQFFARQKVALGYAALIDMKPLRTVAQLQSDRAHELFVSYPLYNDSDMKMFRYGDNLKLLPPSPAVLSLLKGSDVLSSYQSYLIFVLDDGKNSRSALSDTTRRRARLVGFVHVTGDWKPNSEKELFTFAPTAAARR